MDAHVLSPVDINLVAAITEEIDVASFLKYFGELGNLWLARL
jgi:hypothetical protein